MMRKIIFLITTFFYVYPIYLNILPVPTDRIYQFLGFMCFMVNPKDILMLFKSKYSNRYILITVVLLLIAFFPQIWAKREVDFFFVIQIVNVFLHLFSAYFVYRVAIWALENVNVGTAIYYIVLAALLQVVISTIFFIKPEYFDLYYSYLNQSVRLKDYEEMRQLLNIRFIGIASDFFTGTAKYGIALFSVLILPYIHKSYLTENKLLYWIAVLVIVLGGLLTGRTFFIAVLLGTLMITLYKSTSFINFIVENIKVIVMIILMIFILFQILSVFIDDGQLQGLYNFVFELFINLSSGDGLETRSTNHLMEMYIFPESIKTWLFGDGRMTGFDSAYYMKTDVGYIRLLFYFGLPATLCFVYVLYRYCMILYKSHSEKIMKYFCITFFSFLIILNFKGFIFPTYYFALFLIFMVIPKGNMRINTDTINQCQ